MRDQQITRPDGRTVSFADYGSPNQTAVVWCHGGPGSRYEPEIVGQEAERASLRLIGIDRPGYGRSTPLPGRTIGGWVDDAIAVVDDLGIDRFLAVGLSTGGAYALALAAGSTRVDGVVVVAALSDMRSTDVRALTPRLHAVWNARDRETALVNLTDEMGSDGGKVPVHKGALPLAASDREFFADPLRLAWWLRRLPEMYAQGVVGYADDRLADGKGWWSFDVSAVRCPVGILHGGSDTLANVGHAHYTASIVPHASVTIVPDAGHFSICRAVVAEIARIEDDARGVHD